jgi:hypothetical protein
MMENEFNDDYDPNEEVPDEEYIYELEPQIITPPI